MRKDKEVGDVHDVAWVVFDQRAEFAVGLGVFAKQSKHAVLAEQDALTNDFPGLETEAHLLRAAILLAEGRDAESEAGPWCVQFNRDRGAEDLREQLVGAGVCRDWSNGQ